MSLAFLAKKSWHTTNIKNVENVWVREAKKEAEERKLKELRRQIEEERQIEELEQLQEDSGLVKRDFKKKAKLAWMYQGPAANAASGEEYLSGAKAVTLDKEESDVAKLENEQKPGSLWLSKVTNSQNEQFSRINEDPLFHIRKKQQQGIRKVINNPVKMQLARERAIEQLQQKLKKEKKKKSKGEKKKKKKKRKHDSSDSEAEERRKRRKRRKEHKKHSSSRDYSSRDRRSRERDSHETRYKAPPREDTRAPEPAIPAEPAGLYLGPSKEILEMRKAYVKERNEKLNMLRSSKYGGSTAEAPAPESKSNKLEAMKNEGRRHEEDSLRLRALRAQAGAAEEKVQQAIKDNAADVTPGFIRKSQQEIGNKTLEEVVRSKRHTQQRRGEEGFRR